MRNCLRVISRFLSTTTALCLGLLTTCLLAPASLAQESSWLWNGFALARGASVDAAPSWRQNAFGVFETGGGFASDESTENAFGQAHLTLEWQPDGRFGAFIHGVARSEPDAVAGRDIGVVEAYVEANLEARDADIWHLRLGHFILPTSRENTDAGWSSPYTLSFSALNTWIGEEVRPTGLLAAYHLAVGDIDELRFGTSAVWNNDASGTLLAWRGFTLGDRLGVYGEYAPLPPLRGFMPGGAFYEQSERGTKPFASDLDGRMGWATFVRYARPEQASIQYTHYDNRGDRELHVDEYAWRTRFDLVGADLHVGPWSFATEWMEGSTGMGEKSRRHVQLDYEASYYLVSYGGENFRLSARYDDFSTTERDRSVGYDPNDGDGTAWTLAAFYEPERWPLRVGVEWLDADVERTSAGLVLGDRAVGGQSFTIELRYFFGG